MGISVVYFISFSILHFFHDIYFFYILDYFVLLQLSIHGSILVIFCNWLLFQLHTQFVPCFQFEDNITSYPHCFPLWYKKLISINHNYLVLHIYRRYSEFFSFCVYTVNWWIWEISFILLQKYYSCRNLLFSLILSFDGISKERIVTDN